MSALARDHVTDAFAHAANDDYINGGSCNRTKYSYVDNNPLTLTDPTGFDDVITEVTGIRTAGASLQLVFGGNTTTYTSFGMTTDVTGNPNFGGDGSGGSGSGASAASNTGAGSNSDSAPTPNPPSQNETPQGNQNPSSGSGPLDLLGKIWNLPNTVIGLVYGSIGYAVGWAMYETGLQAQAPGITIGNNAIQFTDNPFVAGGLTIGNVEIFGGGGGPGVLGGDNNLMGLHEMQHTFQGQLLGPLYLPSNLLGGAAGSVIGGSWHAPQNWNEVGPKMHPPQPWWW